MTRKNDFLEKLRKRKQSLGENGQSVEQIRDEWRGALRDLYDRLGQWLRPAVEEGLLSVRIEDGPVEEDRLGLYDAPVMIVRLPTGEEVRFLPLRVVFGYEGRVDLVCGARRRSLFRQEDRWVVVWGRSPLQEEPLTQPAFEQVLEDLIPALA